MYPAQATDQRTAARVGEPLILAESVTKLYGDQRAVDGVDLTVAPGTIVGLIGPSGCGKSTLVRMLAGIERPTEGRVRVFGVDPAGAGTRLRSRIGYMPQLPVLFPTLTVATNLSFLASLYGVPIRGRRERLGQLLDLVDLAAHRRKRVDQLSGGMKRRLTLAGTLVHDPELLFLDEPTAGVDPVLRERFWQHFRRVRDEGHTIVVPTQYVNEAVSCDSVAVLAAGRLVAFEPPERLAPLAYGGVPLLVQLGSGWLGRAVIDRLVATPGVRSVHGSEEGLVVVVDDAEQSRVVVRAVLEDSGTDVADVVPLDPTWDEVFVRLLERLAPTGGDPR